MSKDRLLSDEELDREILLIWESLFGSSIKASSPGYVAHYQDFTDRVKPLIQSQKRLYAESVIGDDNWSNSTGTISSGGQTIKKSTYINIRNKLRAEQRARIKQ